MDSRPIRLPGGEDRRNPRKGIRVRNHQAESKEPVAPASKLARFEHASVVSQTPDEETVRIDINGCLAGAVRAIPDALRELAVGWAFLHGFFETHGELGRTTIDGLRVSLMVDGGDDLDRLRLEAVGWQRAATPNLHAAAHGHEEPLWIDETQLCRLIEEAYRQFRKDGAVAGFVHAGIGSDSSVHCIARDITADAAVAKVLGWVICEGRHLESRVLVMHGIVDRRVVRAAARLGVELIVTDAIPTAPAAKAAAGLPISIVGMATSRRMGLFVDGGHVA